MMRRNHWVRVALVGMVIVTAVAVAAPSPAGAVLVPGTPRNVSAMGINSTSVRVNWTPGPAPAANRFIIGIYENGVLPVGESTCWAPCTSVTRHGLNPETNYTAWVWGANAFGRSLLPGTSNSTQTLPPGAPDPVVSATAVASPTEPTVDVSWQVAPTGVTPNQVRISVHDPTTGSPIVQARCYLDPDDIHACDSPSTETVVGLTPGQQVELRVRAGQGDEFGEDVFGHAAVSNTVTVASGCGGSASYCITADATQQLGSAATPAAGLLNTAQQINDHDKLDAMRIQNWRVLVRRMRGQPPDLSNYAAAAATGASVTIMLTEAWKSWTCCVPEHRAERRPWLDWDRYQDWVKDHITAVLDAIDTAGLPPPTYWDVINEPDNITPGNGCDESRCMFNVSESQGVTIERLLTWFRKTYEAVQELELDLDTEIPLIGPSVAIFAARTDQRPIERLDLARFLEYSASGDPLEWAAISWHESASAYLPGQPTSVRFNETVWTDHPSEHIASHADAVSRLLADYPGLGTPELVINEYGPWDRWELPGYQAQALAAIEANNIAQANHTCFPSYNHTDPQTNATNHCRETDDNPAFYSTLNGHLYAFNGSTPYPIYWVAEAYAEMSHDGADRVTTSASHPTIGSFATRRDGTSTVAALVGRTVTCRGGTDGVGIPNGPNLNCRQPGVGPADISATVDYPYAAPNGVEVRVQRIPFTFRNGLMGVEPPLTLLPSQDVTFTSGTATFTLEDVLDGEAVFVTVQPAP